MNDKRREMLKRAASLLQTTSGLVSSAIDGEEDALDNMPENLQFSERCEKMEDTVDAMNEVSECIDTAIEKIRDSVR